MNDSSPISSPDTTSAPIRPALTLGVRDSGVGGLTVAREIKKHLPNARLLYFADTAHVPYGDKTPAQVRHYALSISDFLLQHGAQGVVFACNTTSAYALELARERFKIPIFGVIEPAARVAAQVGQRIGVIATAATVASGVYTRSLKAQNPEIEVCEIACPAFVPLVESEKTNTLEAREACRHYMAPLQRFGADAVVLGCTHYPLLLPALRESAPAMRFIDPAQAVAQEVIERFSNPTEPASEEDLFFVSGESVGVRNWAQTLLEIAHPHIKVGPVFDYD